MGQVSGVRRDGEADADGVDVRSRGEGIAGGVGNTLQRGQKGSRMGDILWQQIRSAKEGDGRLVPLVKRWHVMAGMALLHGYRNGVELGVSGGRFTMFLCATMHEMKMLAVDLWQEQPNNTLDGSQTYEGWDHEGSYRTFTEKCNLFFPGRVDIKRMTTLEAAKHVDDGSVDFVFVDADHSYEGCAADIQAWLPKVRKGGMLAGHDYNWPTVFYAVRDANLKVALGPDNVWMHLKK